MDQLAGRQVQQDILPREPLNCRGYRVSHSIVPSLYLSGDFVGYNSAFDRYILFYFGDVSGHGASSAFITVMLASCCASCVAGTSRNPISLPWREPLPDWPSTSIGRCWPWTSTST